LKSLTAKVGEGSEGSMTKLLKTLARVRGESYPPDPPARTRPPEARARDCKTRAKLEVIGEAVKSWPDGAVDRELGRFRDWAASATGPNAVKSDWQAAWRNWLRKAEDEGRYARPLSPKSAGPPGRTDLVAHILAK